MHICIDTCMCVPVCICDININKGKKKIVTTNLTAKEHKETISSFMLLGLTLLMIRNTLLEKCD